MDAIATSLPSAAAQGVAVQAWFSPSDVSSALARLRELTGSGVQAGAWYVEAKYSQCNFYNGAPDERNVTTCQRGGRFIVVGQAPPSGRHYAVLKQVQPCAE